MFKKIEKMLDENGMAAAMAKGICVSMTIVLIILAVIFLVAVFLASAWWLIAFSVCVIASGAFGGITAYLEWRY